jgi:glycosyltransferase involved in cell wall biosynthesis
MSQKDNTKPVLFISDNFPPVIGGSSTVYDQICKNNAEKIVALTSKTNNKGEYKTGMNDYDQSCGYQIYRTESLRVPPAQKKQPNKIRSLLSEFSLILTLMVVITKLSFTHKTKVICVGELIYGGWIVLFSRYILRKKTIIYTHGEEIAQVADGLYNKHRGIFLRAANKIVAVSLFCKSQIVSLYHIPPDKIEIISNGVDTERFKTGDKDYNLLRKHNIEKTDKVILSVGRLVKRKGHHNLILAMEEIVKSKTNVKLIIIGSGPEEESLLLLANKLNLNDSITFLNNIDDATLISYYQSADIFSMPNITLADGDTEGFGLVFLEANACSKPVVGGQAGGAIEAIIHNQTGLLVDGYNVDQITESILLIIDDKTLYNSLVEKALVFAQESTWEKKSLLFNNLISKILLKEKYDNAQCINNHSICEKISGEKHLHITVDFEEMFDWSDLSNRKTSIQGIDEIENFHKMCLANSIQPTYLVTYDVLQSEEAVSFLKRIYSGNHEIGIHLHPWNSPPFIEQINTFNSFQCNLPAYLEKLKIDKLIELFIQKLGFSPKIHRAGRYGCSQRTLDYLKVKNIQVDLSPSAGYNFNGKGGPNFKSMGNKPFWSDHDKKLLCIPIPYISFFKGPDILTNIVNQQHTLIKYLKKGLDAVLPSSPVRLSPEANTLERMKIIGTLLDQQGVNDFVISVHSTSLYAGGNEYSLSKSDAQKNIDNIIKYSLWSHKNLNTISTTPYQSKISQA